MSLSYGYIETIGLIAAIEAADTMLKAAQINLIQKRYIGSGLVTVVIEGQLGAVQASVDAGCAAADRIGQLVSSNVIPRPYNEDDFFIEKPMKPVKTLPESVEKSESQKTDKKPAAKLEKPTGSKKSTKSIVDPKKMIIDGLNKNKKEGLSLKQIAKLINKEPAETRIVLKDLLDAELIEKVQQKYYLI